MDKKLRVTTNSCVEIMNSNRQVKGKLGHMVQIGVFDVNVMHQNLLHANITKFHYPWCYTTRAIAPLRPLLSPNSLQGRSLRLQFAYAAKTKPTLKMNEE